MSQAPLWNWLKELDEEVDSTPEPNEWQMYSLFYFARYGRHKYLTISDELFRQELFHWTNQLSTHGRIVKGLHAQNLDQLAGLMYDTMFRLEVYHGPTSTTERPLWQRTGLKWKIPRMRKLAGEAKRRKKMLVGKLGKARRTLEELRDYAKGLDPLLSGRDYIIAAKKCLETLGKLTEDTSTDIEESLKDEYSVAQDPTALCMVQLYWFFRHGCELPGDEAEVRVALIRNAFWTKYGVCQVKYRPCYAAAESGGSGAVAEAVRRYR